MRYFFVLVWFCLGGIIIAGDLSHVIIFDEEDAYDALLSGKISYYEYLELIDHYSVESGVSEYLPNILLPSNDTITLPNTLEREQKKTNDWFNSLSEDKHNSLQYTYYTEIEENPQHKYFAAFSKQFNQKLKLTGKLQREYSGRNRWLKRTITYHDDKLDIYAGSFSARYGLGGLIGYHGKLFDFSDDVDVESLVYPDYGGYNGLKIHQYGGVISHKFMHSYQRDKNHSLLVEGYAAAVKRGRSRMQLIGIYSILRDRIRNKQLSLPGMAFAYSYRAGKSIFNAELAIQKNNQVIAPLLLVEGTIVNNSNYIKYTAWSYKDSFTDLTSGGKAASLRESKSIDGLEFSYSNKRAGQSGGMMKTMVIPFEKARLSNGLMLGGKYGTLRRLDYSVRLEYALSGNWQLALDYLTKKKFESGSDDDLTRDLMAEIRYDIKSLSLRSHISYISITDENDALECYLGGRWRRHNAGLLEWQVKIRRFSLYRNQVDNIYLFIHQVFSLTKQLFVHVKLTHQYGRYYSNKHRTTIMFSGSLNI